LILSKENLNLPFFIKKFTLKIILKKMKKLLLTAAVAAMSLGSFAQSSYYFIKKTGVTDAFNWNYFSASGTAAVKILDKPNNDVLSSSQSLPFSFNLYGTSYSSYKASDNGYITFDAAASTSDNSPAALPSASEPNNAIFAFWSDLELKAAPNANFPVGIWNFTYGTSPNRVHVIHWFGVSKKGSSIAANADVLSFAIKLYEGGGFDILHSSFGGSNFSGAIGVQDAGTSATTVAGSPSISFAPSADGTNAKTNFYEFKGGTQPAKDAAVLSVNLGKIYKTGTSINIGGSLVNYGSEKITSLDLNYSIDNGATQTQSLTGLNLDPSGVGKYTYSITAKPWVVGAAGAAYAVKVWTSNVNGAADDNTSNDEMSASVFSNNGTSGTKKVLVEEGSGAWCGFCPDGHQIMRGILDDPNNKDKVFGVIHHNSDKMKNAESDQINGAYATGYPYGVVDRVLFNGQTTVGLNRGLWESKVNERLTATTPVNVTIIDKKFDVATRKLTFTVKADFVDYYSGDLRLNAYVVENDVRGAATSTSGNPDFKQHNYYSKDYPGGSVDPSNDLAEQPEWMIGYKHEHVVRSIPSTAWGTAGIIPAIPAPGSSYQKTYTYTIPAASKVTGLVGKNASPCTLCLEDDGEGMNKVDYFSVIGFVSKYDASNVAENEVLNSDMISSVWGVGVNPITVDANSAVQVFPNPTNDITNINITVSKFSNVTMSLIDMTGKTVQTIANNNFSVGQHNFTVKTSELPNGVYFLNAYINGRVNSQKIVVAH
jgi:hypothetical protein